MNNRKIYRFCLSQLLHFLFILVQGHMSSISRLKYNSATMTFFLEIIIFFKNLFILFILFLAVQCRFNSCGAWA